MSQFLVLTVSGYGRGLFNVERIATVNTPAKGMPLLGILKSMKAIVMMHDDKEGFHVDESVDAIGTALSFLRANPTAGIAFAAHYEAPEEP